MIAYQLITNAGEIVFTGVKSGLAFISKKLDEHNRKAAVLAEKVRQWMGEKAYEFFDDDEEVKQKESEKTELENKIQYTADIFEENAMEVINKIDFLFITFLKFVNSIFGVKKRMEEEDIFDFPKKEQPYYLLALTNRARKNLIQFVWKIQVLYQVISNMNSISNKLLVYQE